MLSLLQIACTAVAALIQYFFLCAFCWMMCEGVMLYLMLVAVFSTLSKKWWLYLLIGWGMAKSTCFVFCLVCSVDYHIHWDTSLHFVCCLLNATNSCYHHTAGIPLCFVVVGLGVIRDDYGVRGSQGHLKLWVILNTEQFATWNA